MTDEVVVVGTGLMGAGIVLGYAEHGASVTYLTRRPLPARDGVAKVADELVAILAADRAPADSVAFCTEIDDLPARELIIESVPEDLALKIPLLAELPRVQPDACSAGTRRRSIAQAPSGLSG